MMKQATFRRTLLAASVSALFALSAPTFAASNTDGAIRGEVVSANDAPLTNATITIKNTETGLTRVLTTDESGRYQAMRLPIGKYSITVNAEGYDSKVQDDVSVTIGSNANVTSVLNQTGMERLAVVGSRISSIDTSSSEASMVMSQVEIERMPVPKDVTSVALLAPGTTRGDSRFGNLASFGGSSVAENSYYINGLNVTDFRNGVGFSNVPFDFYDQFEVKTGGYSAEFGRATGGVVNAVVKRGTNEWKFGANVYYRPDSLRADAPDSYTKDGDLYIGNKADYQNNLRGNVYASGPLVKDKLFFFAMYQPQTDKTEGITSYGATLQRQKADNPFWGLKLDWNIADNHTLEFLAFSDDDDAKTHSYDYDYETSTVGEESPILASDKSGGTNWVTTYTGQLTDDFTAKVTYGVNKRNLTSSSNLSSECNLIYDRRGGTVTDVGCASTADYFVERGADERKEFRADFEWLIGMDHTLRFGYDLEKNSSFSDTSYSGPGGVYWMYYDVNDPSVGAPLANGVTTPVGLTQYAMQRQYSVNGNFETKSQAIYLEDQWRVTDNVTLSLGVRWDSFDNMNANGDSFIKIDDMFAPRLGASWDINGDGNSKLFANYGRYYLPVANNTNVRSAGNEYDVRRYYALQGTQDTEILGKQIPLPIIGDQIGPDQVTKDGSVPDTETAVDQDIDPMYQDEIIIGYQGMLDEDWSWGVKGTQRELNGTLDDFSIGQYLEATYGCQNGTDNFVLGNPGKDLTVKVDTTCNSENYTPNEMVTIPGSALGYPEGERKYYSVDLTLDRAWRDDWAFNFTYTWSHSYGNTEGLVKSDNGQDDAGVTQDFDYPILMDGAYGNLPNDRRHMFKLYGSYAVTDDLSVGANLSIESGRPLNKLGIGSPEGVPDYGDTYYTMNEDGTYTKNPRGSAGRTDWTYRLDLSASYVWEATDDLDVILKANIYNVFNSHAEIRRVETAEDGEPSLANSYYDAVAAYQTPRYVEFSASIKF